MKRKNKQKKTKTKQEKLTKLHKITSMPKKNFKSRLDKQALFQVRIEEVACCLSTQRYFNVIIVLILKAT